MDLQRNGSIPARFLFGLTALVFAVACGDGPAGPAEEGAPEMPPPFAASPIDVDPWLLDLVRGVEDGELRRDLLTTPTVDGIARILGAARGSAVSFEDLLAIHALERTLDTQRNPTPPDGVPTP
jgi:hypothetical protein